MVNLYNLLYKSFPRQIAIPWRKNVDKDEFYKCINKYNGIKRLFSSVYNFTTDEERNNILIDKIFFDFDGNTALDEVSKLVAYLRRENYKYLLLFSGGGFHVYVFTSNYEHLNNVKYTLLNIHNYIQKEANIVFDRAIAGDIARVATIPNTWNTKRRRFCIPLTNEDLTLSYNEIREKAKKQQYNFTIYGDNYFDVKKFDTDTVDNISTTNVCIDNNISFKLQNDHLLKRLPPCVAKMLYEGKEKRIGWRGRYLLIIYLRDFGMYPPIISKILKKYLISIKRGQTEAEHCIRDENQVNYLFNQFNCTFPKCEQMKNEGYCPIEGYCQYTREFGNKHLVKIYK